MINISEYPYAHVSAKLKDFLDKIPSTGVPDKVTYNELAARGFKSTNDRSILGVLKFLTLVDAEGIPTEKWTAYRNKSNNKLLLGTLVQLSYSELFSMYPNAQERADEEIRNFIASKTKVGEDTIQRIVTTFKMLCSMSDFSSHTSDAEPDEQDSGSEVSTDEALTDVSVKQRATEIRLPARSTSVPITINIHIHLPETDGVKAAEGLIKNVAHYLLGREIED